jgi:hypothetical protein
MRTLYAEVVRTLAKATGNNVPKAFVRKINAAHDKTEARIARLLQAEFDAYRKRLHHIVATRLAKADSLQVQISQAVQDALGASFADALPEEFEELVQSLVESFQADLSVKVNFQQVNDAVTKALRESNANYFADFSDNEANGIYHAIADAMSADEGYSVQTIALNVLASPVVYGKDLRMDPQTWATTVARTETARATSTAQRESLYDLGLKTWQWLAQFSACDECDDNADEILAIGDDFPSGDDEPPAHPNCRCVVLPVMDELLSTTDE